MRVIIYSALFVLILLTETKSQWVEQTLPANLNVTLGIDFINQNHGVTGGWYGDISQQIYCRTFYTTNGGNNWIEASVPDSMRVMVEAQLINENLGYGAGAYNLGILETNSQTNQNSIQNINHSIKEFSEKIGMNFSRQENYRGYFVETTDGGLNWHPKGSFDNSVYYLVGISFIDQQTGFVIASSEFAQSYGLLKTTDGGNTWNFVIQFQPGIFVNDVRFFEQTGFLIYDNSTDGTVFLQKTTDGGSSWSDPIPLGLLSGRKISFSNSNTIFVGGTNALVEGSVIKSTDGGISWQEIRTYNDMFISGIEALENTDFLLSYGTNITPPFIPFVDISLNGGSNWNYTQLTQFQDYIPLYSKMVNSNNWYITGTQNIQSGFIWFTDNSGGVPVELSSFSTEPEGKYVRLNWSTATELNNLGFEVERSTNKTDWRLIGFKEGNGTTTETNNYSFVDYLFGINSSKLYYRLKQIDFDGTFEYSNIIEAEVSAPSEFYLSQNYPNPFNPTTNIEFRIADFGFVSLKVFDIIGNEITTLINEEKQPGEYEVEFGTSGIRNLVSGIYFYQLKAGNFTQTKKMILLQ